MAQLDSKPLGWRECARRCPCTSRRFLSCRLHYSRTRLARQCDGSSSNTNSPLFNRSRLLSTCEKNGDNFNSDSDATAFSVNMNNFLLIDFVLFENQNGPYQGHTFNTGFLLFWFYFTILYHTSFYKS